MEELKVAVKPKGASGCRLFCNPGGFYAVGLVSALALLGVDCAVAMGNAHMVPFSSSLSPSLCVLAPAPA